MRLIPRLDIKGPNVVKGIQLDCYRVVGLPERLAELYYHQGADEILFLDTVASLYQREPNLEVIRRTAQHVFIPITVGGGIRTTGQIREILRAGADKVAINTGGIHNPNLLKEAVKMFGSQCIVASLEVHRRRDRFEVWVDNGRQPTGIDALEWAKKAVDLGCGEILVTAIHREGRGDGFDNDLISTLVNLLPVPVIACGGAGSKEHLADTAKKTNVSALSAASIFHYHYCGEYKDDIAFHQRYGLRNGKSIDTGNVDFMHLGYGHIKSYGVQPCSLVEAKNHLRESGVPTRV